MLDGVSTGHRQHDGALQFGCSFKTFVNDLSVLLNAIAALVLPLRVTAYVCVVSIECVPLAEGVLYAEKDFNLQEHPEIPGVSNLQVIKLMQSFTSKELVTERFAWRHYYW